MNPFPLLAMLAALCVTVAYAAEPAYPDRPVRDDVVGAARRKRHDDAHRSIGIRGLRCVRDGDAQGGEHG